MVPILHNMKNIVRGFTEAKSHKAEEEEGRKRQSERHAEDMS